MKLVFVILLSLGLLLNVYTALADSAESPEQPLSVTLDILDRGADAFYGCDVNISIPDFIALGFELGDECDVLLENDLYRYEFKSIPFYNGYYTKTGDPLLCGYGYAVKENRGTDYRYNRTDYPYLRFCYNGREMWNVLNLTTDMKCTITLVKRGGYEYEQKLVGGLTYSNNFDDYEAKNGVSKEDVFANFRPVRSAAIKENVLFRSASPFDNANNRAPYVSALAKENGIDYVLNLADSEKNINQYKASEFWPELEYSRFLLDTDRVCLMPMSGSYVSTAIQPALVKGLNGLLAHNATKILFHCTEGKDRTGFVAIILECFCGATYEEMRDDYMLTYDNYYSLTEASDKTAYDYIVDLKFNDMINFLLAYDPSLDEQDDGTYDLTAVTPENYATAAWNFLKDAGMSEENLQALAELLKK